MEVIIPAAGAILLAVFSGFLGAWIERYYQGKSEAKRKHEIVSALHRELLLNRNMLQEKIKLLKELERSFQNNSLTRQIPLKFSKAIFTCFAPSFYPDLSTEKCFTINLIQEYFSVIDDGLARMDIIAAESKATYSELQPYGGAQRFCYELLRVAEKADSLIAGYLGEKDLTKVLAETHDKSHIRL